jgi:dihydroxyacetone kinase-like protein
MPATVDYDAFTGMLKTAADKIITNRDHLSKLDAATGDGDHGTAMAKVAKAIIATIDSQEGNDLKKLLKAIGWAAMSTDAGSTSPLYGSLFVGMSEAVPEDSGELDCQALASVMESGAAKLRKNTRAEVGDKTMIDTLVPALAALRAAADSGKAIDEALSDAETAAATGAASTKDLKATFGRAKNLGDRSIGHLDPGATSMSLLFTGLKEGLAAN